MLTVYMDMLTKMPKKNAVFFECEICDFICCKQSNFDKHVFTRKHILLTKQGNVNKNAKKLSCSLCSKQYLSRVGLWKHEKKCIKDNENLSELTDITSYAHDSEKEINNAITKDMFMELLNDNKEMIKIIKDQQEQIKNMIPKIGNTINNTTNNNNFNLNVFLNEQCKDAININEFIKSLKITLEDIYFTRKNGIAQGISNLMINGLKELDVYKRPIHCTDFKRDTVYIKEDDKWEKDDNNRIMKKTIENKYTTQLLNDINKLEKGIPKYSDYLNKIMLYMMKMLIKLKL